MINPFGSMFPGSLGLPQMQPQTPGLLANPSAFQFLDSMLNQPGGFNGQIPGFGTNNPFGMPMFLPEVISPRTLAPSAVGNIRPPVQYSGGGSGGNKGSER